MNSQSAYALFVVVVAIIAWLMVKPRGVRVAHGSLIELLIRRCHEIGRWWWCFGEALDLGYRHFVKRRQQITVDRPAVEVAREQERVHA